MALTQPDLEACLAHTPEETLARWYVDLNRWRWPRDCPLSCPEGFMETATYEEKQRMAKPLWDYVHTHTTAASRSRAWWLLALHRSETAWQVFWALPVCPSCQLRHLDGQCSSGYSFLQRWSLRLRRAYQALYQKLLEH